MRFKKLMVSALLAATLTACGDTESIESLYVERPVEVIYRNAHEELLEGNYILAAQEFDEVERQHPYSIWARRALVMAAFTYYLQNKYDEAIATSRRFLALYPGNEQAAYIYYLMAMCQYERVSDVQRDQRTTELAQFALREVIRRYPDTPYAADAVLKLDLTNDNLAGKEMAVGRFYLNRGEFAAAAGRFRNVIERFSTTSHVPEALHRITEAYLSLGVVNEAQNAAAVLGYNFPDSDWYRDSYRILRQRDLKPRRDDKSWLSKTLDKVL
ncbi:MAG: outer membrane protein assembly factor BamD [Parvibaculales bacterium]